MKCTKRLCPMQHDIISEDCDVKNCPYRTEDIDPQIFMNTLCNYIADLVVQKLNTKRNDTE